MYHEVHKGRLDLYLIREQVIDDYAVGEVYTPQVKDTLKISFYKVKFGYLNLLKHTLGHKQHIERQ
ncbi:hypothetical protein SAMN02745781_03657 [Vibrio gazogenes DSM 21264]|uniref:Uncharacterized protein n=1 Tax=Vibrio gazogenes DSM 21264 = NBRC 103151 TaxID=1123492 RepID=A0A1M5G1M9_VIBGA|nr:hypothetical protein SAMN02745781_03657 [Vibrio gazogenes DSM 21264] [Vibrio gazogenes DSM 21264 = NBRC 103151]